MHEREARGVQVEVEAAAQVVVDGVGGEVEDVGGRGARFGRGWQRGRALAAEARGGGLRWVAEPFAHGRVFDYDA